MKEMFKVNISLAKRVAYIEENLSKQIKDFKDTIFLWLEIYSLEINNKMEKRTSHQKRKKH